MVAYSFKPMFGHQVSSLTKRQTVRADRKRHARPGEAVQLFQGMRTRNCVKLVNPDPLCTRVRPIVIVTSPLLAEFIASIAIDGRSLHRDEIEAFAAADGFGIEHVGDWRFKRTGQTGSARWNMGAFWEAEHGEGLFEGKLIEWEPA
ncbi:MAG: ASCH domain-containing protein [Mesorhizobium sp.]|uniref:ASCH domain-containing protein n=1 Tax=Mesorhizobium sp. TaxID=1871066 RepID=UPI000FE681D0|nr:ASCH domain-containing protein [Mesorhizobium sp.]RWG12249.1 MAG: ASCH domain-containing protein [Mesorhizobium sp.]